MKYNFDKEVKRLNTDCVKWNNLGEGVLPMFIADMEFEVLPEITNAIIERAKHGVFGYNDMSCTYRESVCSWLKRRHEMNVEHEWIVVTDSVLAAIVYAIEAYTDENDAIIIQSPVYNRFTTCIENCDRKVVRNSLLETEDGYRIDFEDFENKIINNNVKAFILCSPHNPVGRVWMADEIEKMVKICARHDVMLMADEIHHDFISEGHKFVSICNVPSFEPTKAIILTSPSKTFNIAGLKNANALIPDKANRELFKKKRDRFGGHSGNIFGLIATEQAYLHGDEYVDQLKKYIEDNGKYLSEFLSSKYPKVRMTSMEATYLAWVDFRAYGSVMKDIHYELLKKAKIAGSNGASFGEEGIGFERINVGCPRSQLLLAIDKLDEYLSKLEKGDIV